MYLAFQLSRALLFFQKEFRELMMKIENNKERERKRKRKKEKEERSDITESVVGGLGR